MIELIGLKEQAAIAALNRMYKDGFFSICTVDAVGDMLGVCVRGSEEYLILRTVHCVNFNTMPNELRNSIPELIRRCLKRGTEFRFGDLDKKVIDVNGFGQRMLSWIK